MVFFVVAIKILVFALCLGAALAVLIFVPLAIYVIPYALWVGNENTSGRQKDKKNESVFRSAKNATKLYKAWITHQKPTL